MYDERGWRGRRAIGLGFLALFAVLVGAMVVFMWYAASRGMPVGSYYMFPWGFGWLWALFGFFLFFGLLRWAFFPWHWGGHYRRYGYGSFGRENEAYQILRERYARGEITKDQYEAMMRDLSSPPRPGP